VTPNHQILISQQSPSKVSGWVQCSRRRTRQPNARTLMLRLPIPLSSRYPARVWFLDGGSFTLGKFGAEKVRGQSVDISKEKAPQISVYGAFSCLETWCRRSESNWHRVTPTGFWVCRRAYH